MYQVPADNSEARWYRSPKTYERRRACRRQTSGLRSSQRSGSSCCRGKPKADGPWFGGVVVPVSCRDESTVGPAQARGLRPGARDGVGRETTARGYGQSL